MTRRLLLIPLLALIALIGYYAAEYFYGTRRIKCGGRRMKGKHYEQKNQ